MAHYKKIQEMQYQFYNTVRIKVILIYYKLLSKPLNINFNDFYWGILINEMCTTKPHLKIVSCGRW